MNTIIISQEFEPDQVEIVQDKTQYPDAELRHGDVIVSQEVYNELMESLKNKAA